MKSIFSRIGVIIFIVSFNAAAFADEASEAKCDQKLKEFQIIDEKSDLVSDPSPIKTGARKNWTKACDDWKKEMKELNGKNLLSLSCGSANCAAMTEGSYECKSTATYKIKVEGKIIPPAPEAAKESESKEPVVVQAPPPEPVLEIVPEARAGFIWVPGYWGWVGHRHIWFPGRWNVERRGFVWIGHSWVRGNTGWEFRIGHWGHR